MGGFKECNSIYHPHIRAFCQSLTLFDQVSRQAGIHFDNIMQGSPRPRPGRCDAGLVIGGMTMEMDANRFGLSKARFR